jgi:hypothetical protein
MPLYVSLVQDSSGQLSSVSLFSTTEDGALFTLRRHYPEATIKMMDRIKDGDEVLYGRQHDDGRGVVARPVRADAVVCQ